MLLPFCVARVRASFPVCPARVTRLMFIRVFLSEMEFRVAICSPCLAGEVRGSKSQAEGDRPSLKRREQRATKRKGRSEVKTKRETCRAKGCTSEARKPGETA